MIVFFAFFSGIRYMLNNSLGLQYIRLRCLSGSRKRTAVLEVFGFYFNQEE